ncbi:MAG: FecR domain-containing protein [Rhodoferax sp.]|nr:FecR domain-containing protein [Rhodoferax sp.]
MKICFPNLALSLSCALIFGATQSALPPKPSPSWAKPPWVVGTARITSASGLVSTVNRGSPIHVGDRIETESGGHVHVRFVDGGRLSVRPSSRLQVENYSYSAQQPALTAIKFKLDEGVVRSITGSWGEGARDKFRLNTPVAAIGVKGTDFVVRSDAEATAASVYTGAIVLAALSGGCQASLGPCQNGGEKLLSQDMKGQMLELGREQASPRLVPLVDLLALNTRRVTTERSAKADKQVGVEVGRAEPSAADKTTGAEALPAGGVVVSAVQPSVKPELTTGPVLPPTPPPIVNQLVWGRWAWAGAVEGDILSKSFESASQNGRQITVANSVYGLFRETPANGAMELTTSEATASFRLANSSAQLVNKSGGSELATVDNGSLNLDFTRRTFTTQLAVSNATLGTSQVNAAGTVRNDGVFVGQSGNAHVAGALSLDAKEAGYLFEKNPGPGRTTPRPA